MLMLELAETNKKAAMEGIKDIEVEQAKKKAMADALNQARDMKTEHRYLNPWGVPDGIPESLKTWAKENNIRLPNNNDAGSPLDLKKLDAA